MPVDLILKLKNIGLNLAGIPPTLNMLLTQLKKSVRRVKGRTMPLTREIQSFAVKGAGESCQTNIKKKGNVLNEKKNLMLTAPYNDEAEAIVLCSVLLEPNLIHKVRATLDTSDFFSHRHKRIFASMIKLSSDKEPIDILTVCGALENDEDKMYVTSVIEEATCTRKC